MEHIFRVFDFNVYNEQDSTTNDSGSEDNKKQRKDKINF